ncbi:glycosyltransferase family 88 protein [Legionella lytica]|uniref:Glycosyltransferase family 88 protein n=1 Tax=Legionella lytica TaxID=96232 RepID=A0ABW8D5P9_9GAMM
MKRVNRYKPNFKLFSVIDDEVNEGVYSFSTKNWTRIWFTTNPDQFIPQKNKEKIIEFLTKFPSRKISLIYDSRLLGTQGKEDFLNFKQELSILNRASQLEFYDFSAESFQENLLDANELELYALANMELQNLSHGGNVGAASDVVRTLSVLYRSGIYTDFDVEFPDSNLEEIKTSSPFLCSVNGNARCNDILAIHPEMASKTDLLEKYHTYIKHAYRLCSAYNSDELAQYKLEMSLTLMNSVEDSEHELASAAVEKLFALMTNMSQDFHSFPMIFLIRKACEEAIKNADEANFKKIYRKIYMSNVISSAGPSALPPMSNSEERDCGKLHQLVRGQAVLRTNDCGWIPPGFETPKINEQEKTDSQILRP